MHLYATSTVSAVAFDTARRVSAQGASCASVDAAGHVRASLGAYGERIAEPVCDDGGEVTTVTVTGPTPARLVGVVGGALGLGGIERTARVRTEEFRAPAPP